MMTAAELKITVDALGDLRARISALRTDERTLTDTVASALAGRKSGSISGSRYHGCLAATSKTTITVKRLFNAVEPDVFLDCVSADLAACRRALPDGVFDRIAEVKAGGPKLRISAHVGPGKKGGG